MSFFKQKLLVPALLLVFIAEVVSCGARSGNITDTTGTTDVSTTVTTEVTSSVTTDAQTEDETPAVIPEVSLNDIPDFQGSGNVKTYDCGDGVYMKYIGLALLGDYNSYLSLLESKGYTQLSKREVNGNYFAEYVNKENISLYSYYIPSEKAIRTVVSPYIKDKKGTGEKKSVPAIIHVGINFKDVVNGMSFIIRTPEGSFIVIDGGWEGQGEARKILDLLKEHNTVGGQPRVAAWVITHPHSDHLGALAEFITSKYYEQVKLERIIYNFVNDDILKASDATKFITDSNSIYNRVRNALKGPFGATVGDVDHCAFYHRRCG